MTNVLKSKIAKAGLGLLVAAGLAVASTAGAMTLAEAQALVAALGLTGSNAQMVLALATPATTTTTTSGSCYQFTKTLAVGSKGADVTALQTALKMSSATGYFGNATKAAVMSYQTSNGLTAVGMVGPATRAKLNASCTSSTTTTTTDGTTTTTQTGPVTAMLATDNPAAGTIIAGSAGADLAHVTFTGNGTVTSLMLKRGGVSDSSTLTNVYLYDGATRLTDGYTFNNAGVLTMNNLGLTVNGSKTVAIKADVYSLTGSYSVKAIVTGFMVSGSTTAVSTNLVGNEMYVASGTNVLATANLTTTAPSPAATSINAGSLNQTLWSNNLSVGLHASQLKGMLVKQVGSAPTNALANVSLYVDGVKAGSATMNTNSQFVFDMSATPMALSTGSHLLEVRGDVVGGANRNFYLSLEKSSDLVVVDPQTSNTAVSVTYLTSTLNNVNGGLVTINNGSLTVNQDPAFSNTTTLVGGATNVKLAAWKFTSYGEDVKINNLHFTPTFTGLSSGATTLANVGLYVNGGQVGSNFTATSGSDLPFASLGSNLVVAAGTPATVELRGDIVSSTGTAITSGTVHFDLVAGSSNAQGMSSSQLTATNSSGGQTLTIGNNVVFGATAGFSTSTKAPNAQQVKIGSFSLAAGSAEGLTVNSISVTLPSGASNTMVAANQLTNLTVKNGTTVIGTPIGNPVVTTSNTFNTSGMTVAQGSTQVFDVYADFGSSSATETVTPSMSITYRGNTSNLSATTSTIAGSTTTANVAVIVAAGVTFNNGLSLSSQAVTGPATSFPIGTFNFKSNNAVAGAVIKDVTVTVPANTVTSVTMNGQTGTVVGTTATIYNVGVTVPASSDGVNVPVTVGLVCVGTANGCNANSPVNVLVTITGVTYNNGTSVLSVSPVANNATNTHYIYASKPTLAVDTVQKTGLVLGAENKVGEVTITADAAGQIKVNSIAFNVATTGLAGSSVTTSATRIADGNTTISGSSVGSGCNVTTADTVGSCVMTLGTSPSGYTIAAGTSKTFSLYMRINATPVASTVVSVSSSVSASGLSWDDSVGGGTNQDGSHLYNFPTGSYSIRQ
ncbi:MAG: peptidoglycan-binding domain-containing protein [bacterium]